MSLSASERHDRSGSEPTANERLKSDGRRRLHWSIVASVWIHVAVFAGWPSFDVQPLPENGEGRGSALELLALGSVAPPLLPAPAPSVPPPSDTEDTDEDEERDDEDAQASEGEEGSLPPSLEERWRGAALDRLASVAPEVVPAAPEERVPVEESSEAADSAAESGNGAVRVGSGDSELVYERLSDEEMLQLGRLSALRPELALVSPSSWLVVQNPSEVGAFMRRRFGPERTPSTGRNLSVSVWIDERGSVEWAEINRSSGRQDLDTSALELFRNVVTFRPAREDGLRVPVAAIFWLTW